MKTTITSIFSAPNRSKYPRRQGDSAARRVEASLRDLRGLARAETIAVLRTGSPGDLGLLSAGAGDPGGGPGESSASATASQAPASRFGDTRPVFFSL